MPDTQARCFSANPKVIQPRPVKSRSMPRKDPERDDPAPLAMQFVEGRTEAPRRISGYVRHDYSSLCAVFDETRVSPRSTTQSHRVRQLTQRKRCSLTANFTFERSVAAIDRVRPHHSTKAPPPRAPNLTCHASTSRRGVRQTADDSPRRNGRDCRSHIRTQPRTPRSRRQASTVSARRAQDARV